MFVVTADLPTRLLPALLSFHLINMAPMNQVLVDSGATADNTGLRSLCIHYHNHFKTQYLKKNPDCEDLSIKNLAESIFWVVQIKIGDTTSETLFQGDRLQQLVDAVFEYVEVKAQDRRSWAFHLQGSLLAEPIGDYYKDFSADKKWGLTWNSICLPVLVNRGEIINVELTPKGSPIPAFNSAVSAGASGFKTD